MPAHALRRLLFGGTVLFLAACGSGTAPDAPATGSNAPAAAQTVAMTIGDYFVGSKTTNFVAGVPYHLVVKNTGKAHHDFLIMHPMAPSTASLDTVYKQALVYIYNIGPDETKTLDYTFAHTAPAGMLEFACHYGGHYEAGMHQPIVVTAPAGQADSPYPNNAVPTADAAAGTAAGACVPPVTLTIGAAGIRPATVSIKKGETLSIANGTAGNNTLTTTPDAGIRFTVVNKGETEKVAFTKPGTFALSSQESPRNIATVTVSADAGVTCGAAPVASIAFNADFTRAAADRYFFIPTAATIVTGQSVAFSNLTDQDLTFTALPALAQGNIQIDKNEAQSVTFGDNGTFTLSCLQFPNQKVVITVNDPPGAGN
jgi:uncharacterized cupredoxin-like copper-binding protein